MISCVRLQNNQVSKKSVKHISNIHKSNNFENRYLYDPMLAMSAWWHKCVICIFQFLLCLQGVWMGLLTASGSLARTLGPVFVSEVYDAYGPRVTFVSMISMTTVTIVGLIVVFRKLIPFKSGAKVVSVK